MLTDRPEIGDQEIQSWYLYMAKRFGPQVATVLAATKSGRPAKIEPEWDRQGHPMLEIFAGNGAMFLAPALFDWTLDQLDEKGSESVLENLPWIMLVLEDWSQQTDCFMRFSGAIENGLMAIAIEKDVPNLGPALLNLPSPYRSAGNLFSEYRDAFLYFGRSNADELAVIQDLRVPDEDVIDDCKRLVGFVYENYGVYQNYPAETLEAFYALLEKQVESNRETLKKEDVPVDDFPDVSPLRLAVMASIVRYERLCVTCRELYRLPVHRSIEQWKKVRQGASPTRAPFPTEMCDLSRAFVMRPLTIEDSWRTAQAIRSASLIFFVRSYLAEHGELPESLAALNAGEAIIDPVTNREFKYNRIDKSNAELDIASIDDGVRRRWKLVVK